MSISFVRVFSSLYTYTLEKVKCDTHSIFFLGTFLPTLTAPSLNPIGSVGSATPGVFCFGRRLVKELKKAVATGVPKVVQANNCCSNNGFCGGFRYRNCLRPLPGVGRAVAKRRTLLNPSVALWCVERRSTSTVVLSTRVTIDAPTWPPYTAGMSKETLAQRLQRLRHRAGITQRQLADGAGVSIAAVRNWEQDRRILGFEVAVRVTQVLGCTLDELAGLAGESATLPRSSTAAPSAPAVEDPKGQEKATAKKGGRGRKGQ
jgi:transcriptional regulator with XRE-family HTH domain